MRRSLLDLCTVRLLRPRELWIVLWQLVLRQCVRLGMRVGLWTEQRMRDARLRRDESTAGNQAETDSRRRLPTANVRSRCTGAASWFHGTTAALDVAPC